MNNNEQNIPLEQITGETNLTEEQLESQYLQVEESDIKCTDRCNRICCWFLFVSIVSLIVTAIIRGAVRRAVQN